MIPFMTKASEIVMHHPETPAFVQLRQLCQFIRNILVLLPQLRFVVINRCADAKQYARLPQTKLVLLLAIINKLPLLSRRQSFFEITSFNT